MSFGLDADDLNAMEAIEKAFINPSGPKRTNLSGLFTSPVQLPHPPDAKVTANQRKSWNGALKSPSQSALPLLCSTPVTTSFTESDMQNLRSFTAKQKQTSPGLLSPITPGPSNTFPPPAPVIENIGSQTQAGPVPNRTTSASQK